MGAQAKRKRTFVLSYQVSDNSKYRLVDFLLWFRLDLFSLFKHLCLFKTKKIINVLFVETDDNGLGMTFVLR